MVIYGIDVSKNSLEIFSKTENRDVIKKKVSNKLVPIERFLSKLEKGAILCLEDSGIYCQLISHLAFQFGVQVALVDPYTLKHSIGSPKGKSDDIDAERIHEYAERFHDKLIYYEGETSFFREIKQLYNLRNLLNKHKKALLSVNTNDSKLVSCSVFGHKKLKASIAHLNRQILDIEKELIGLINKSELKRKMEIITSINGIGPITALELILTTGNFKKLNSAKKAAAYAGVCPYPNQSGAKQYKSKIHPRTDRRLKSLLYLCGLNACRHNKDYRQYRDRKLSEGKHFYLVMNNVSNKLIRTVYALIGKEQTYDFSYVQLDSRWENSEDLNSSKKI